MDALNVPARPVPTATDLAVQVATGKEAAQLHAVLTERRSKRVSVPIVSTADNVPAFVNFTQGVPYKSTTQTIIPNGGMVQTTEQNFQFVNSPVTIWPRINADGTTTLGIGLVLRSAPSSPEPSKIPDILDAPLVLQTVPDGGTVAVRLNLSSDGNSDTLLVFITPTIQSAPAPPKTPPPP